jgi:transposase-like protein
VSGFARAENYGAACDRLSKARRKGREEAARLVVETSRPIAAVSRELGISETSLGNWVRAYREKHAEDEPPLQLSERARLRELERENRELRMKADFLSKARCATNTGGSVR